MQLIILAFGVVALIGRRVRSESSHDGSEVMPYAFSYGVGFPPTGDTKEHREVTSPTGLTQGEYRWLQPNGLFRVVRYYIDGPSGFIAQVTEEKGPEVINYVSSDSNGLENVLNLSDTRKGVIPIDSVAGKENLGFQTPDLPLRIHNLQTSERFKDPTPLHDTHNVQEYDQPKSYLASQGYEDSYKPLKYPGQHGADLSIIGPLVDGSLGLEPLPHHESNGIRGLHVSQEGKGPPGYQDPSGIYGSLNYKDHGNLPGSQFWTFGRKNPEPAGEFYQDISSQGLVKPQVIKEFPFHSNSQIHFDGNQQGHSPPHHIEQENLDWNKQNSVFLKTNPVQIKNGYDYTSPQIKTTLTRHDVYSSKDVGLSDHIVTFPDTKFTGPTSYDFTPPKSSLSVHDSDGSTKQKAGINNIGPIEETFQFDHAAPKLRATAGISKTEQIYKDKELSTISKVRLSQPNDLKSNIRISSVSFLELTPEGILKPSKADFSTFNKLGSIQKGGIKTANSGLSWESSLGAKLLTQSLFQGLSSVQNRDTGKDVHSHHQGDNISLLPKVTYVKKIEDQPGIHRQTIVSQPHLHSVPDDTHLLKEGFTAEIHSPTNIEDGHNTKKPHLFGKGGLNIDYTPSKSYLPPPPGGNARILKIGGESDLSQAYELPHP